LIKHPHLTKPLKNLNCPSLIFLELGATQFYFLLIVMQPSSGKDSICSDRKLDRIGDTKSPKWNGMWNAIRICFGSRNWNAIRKTGSVTSLCLYIKEGDANRFSWVDRSPCGRCFLQKVAWLIKRKLRNRRTLAANE
jgi:hypothetical protein